MLDISSPLILIGPTGAGKTTVGRVLAAKLNVS
ncbi:MAG: shikimate kinase, partial [Gammaproteobacteria bacterium]|nr:shikimate kinase [Gammaproteobacteria bacterium]